MCRNNDHGGRRCPASANKAKRSLQNRAYYLAHKGATSSKTGNSFAKSSPVDALTLKLNNLPSADSMRDHFNRKAKVTTINSTVWSKDGGVLVFDGEHSHPELEKEEQAHVDAISAALTNDFVHGELEYKLEVDGIELTSDEKNIWNKTEPMKALVKGYIYDTSGNRMGYWERAIHFPENEPAVVEYRSLDIYPSHQGKGLGRNVIKFFDRAMKSWGAENVKVEANCDVGGYAWAKSGYDWDPAMRFNQHETPDAWLTQDRWDRQQSLIRDSLQTEAEITGDPDGSISAMVERLKQPYNVETYPTPFEVADTGRALAKGLGKSQMWAGKRVMLDSSWLGTRKL